MHRGYFRLRKPIERRMYELARKHCGKQGEWKISLQLLQKKCGSFSTEKEFRRLVSKIVEEDQKYQHMPDYMVILEHDSDIVIFRSRGTVPADISAPRPTVGHLRGETYEQARRAAPGWDVYYLEQEWRSWMTERPRDPDAAFIGFCKKVFERRGKA